MVNLITTRTQAGNYTIKLIDVDLLLDFTSAGNITIPNDKTVNFPINSEIFFRQTGTGTVTFVPATGVKIESLLGNKKIAGQFGYVYLIKVSANLWHLVGNLK